MDQSTELDTTAESINVTEFEDMRSLNASLDSPDFHRSAGNDDHLTSIPEELNEVTLQIKIKKEDAEDEVLDVTTHMVNDRQSVQQAVFPEATPVNGHEPVEIMPQTTDQSGESELQVRSKYLFACVVKKRGQLLKIKLFYTQTQRLFTRNLLSCVFAIDYFIVFINSLLEIKY